MKKQFRPVSLSGAPRKTLGVSRFLGVDLTTPKFLIENGRAVDSLNFIYKDNVLQKRHGFEELFKVKPTTYALKNFDGSVNLSRRENGVNFNNMWSFIAEDGKRHVIAHIGKLLYELFEDKDPQLLAEDYIDNKKHYKITYEYENYNSSAFVGDYKLWFLGGNKFMCIRFLLNGECLVEPVEDSETLAFIPTTTISITYSDSRATGRQSFDKVNLLTQFRKNKLISGTFKKQELDNATPYYEYPLDSPLIAKNGRKDMTRFHMTIEERGVIDNG